MFGFFPPGCVSTRVESLPWGRCCPCRCPACGGHPVAPSPRCCPYRVSRMSCWWDSSFSLTGRSLHPCWGCCGPPGFAPCRDWEALRCPGTLSSALPRGHSQLRRQREPLGCGAGAGAVNHNSPGSLGSRQDGTCPAERQARLCPASQAVPPLPAVSPVPEPPAQGLREAAGGPRSAPDAPSPGRAHECRWDRSPRGRAAWQ